MSQKLPQGGPGAIQLPHPGIYQVLGVEGIVRMIRDFYRVLSRSPIAFMFPEEEEELMASAEKSALFWVTACGGPPLYQQQFGPPQMRARHLKFPIDQKARDHWLACWEPVLAGAGEAYGFPQEHLESFRAYLEGFSAWMINS